MTSRYAAGIFPHMSGDRIGRAAFLAVTALACGWLAYFFISADFAHVLTVIPDDASYFLEIADNAAAGYGLTFDRITPTNGFQPLWLYILAPLYRIVQAEPETMLRIVALLQILLVGAAGVMLFRLLRDSSSPDAAFLGGVLYAAFVLSPAVNAMESALLVFIVVALLRYALRRGFPDRSSALESLSVGLLLGLSVLARLDMIFLCVSLGLFLLLGARRGGKTGRRLLIALAFAAVGSSLVVAPYLVFNIVRFGGAVPISGELKTSFPLPSPNMLAITAPTPFSLFGLLLAAFHLASTAWRRRGRTDAPGGQLDKALAVFAAAVILHWGHTALFMRWAVFQWHFISYKLLAVLVLPGLVHSWTAKSQLRFRRAVMPLCIAASLAVGIERHVRRYSNPARPSWSAASHEAALWARTNTPAEALFAMKDAGHFGHFSERRVISLDGVVGDLEFQRILRERRLRSWLALNRVDYIAQHAFWDDPSVAAGDYETFSMAYTSRLYSTESDTLRLDLDDEVYRSTPYFAGPGETVIVIWRFRPPLP
jgi:hypothetical protein